MKNRIGWIVLLLTSIIVNIYTTNIYQSKIVAQENEIAGWEQYYYNGHPSQNMPKLKEFIQNTKWRAK